VPLRERPSAVLLDLDGTLVRSHDVLWEVYSAFVERHGGRPSRAEFVRLDGPSIPEIVRSLQATHRIDVDLDVLERSYDGLLEERYPAVAAAPDADQALRSLGEFYVLAVVTSAPASLVERLLTARGWADVFAAVVTGNRGPSKPDPALYEVAIAELGLPAVAAVAVEDSPNGVRSAVGAGVPVIGVTADDERGRALQEAGADAVVPDLRALMDILR
jgi:beta-phosphoglucomutase-like phosphatase (HAD superfamily)